MFRNFVISLFGETSRFTFRRFNGSELQFPVPLARWFLISVGAVASRILWLLKGTVARDFWPLVFFMNRPHMGP
jgi:hypothetical protein